MALEIQASDIKRKFIETGIISAHLGADTTITRIAPIEACEPGDLVFAGHEKLLEFVRKNRPSAVVVPESLRETATDITGIAVLTSHNVGLAHAVIKQAYAAIVFLDDEWERIHPSAVIHPSARIALSTMVGANAVIGKGVTIGERCRIFPGVVIEHGVRMGNDCNVFANAVIGYLSQIGNEVEIGAGSSIGSEGFGFAQDKKGRSYKIPHTGVVVIADRVRIGASNCIDRGTYRETSIGSGTKTDNLCHIAHNVQIGEDCLLTAMFCSAGSTVIGDRVKTSGQTGVLDHMTICDDVMLLHRAGVTKNIDQPGMYAGLPAQPLQKYLKNTCHALKLDEMKCKLSQLEKWFNPKIRDDDSSHDD